MKTFAIRLSVLTLALSGFAATTVVSQAAPKKFQIKTVRVGGNCPPVCMPSDPTHCGMR